MHTTHGRVVHVWSLADFDSRVPACVAIAGWRVHGVDLSGRVAVLERLAVAGASFLGCGFAAGQADALRTRGALVLAEVETPAPLPVRVDRSSLYRAEELYDAPTWAASLDGRAYAWSQTRHDAPAARDATLARALHDHAIDEALLGWVRGRRLVGVMGGHAWRRDDPAYADAARLGRGLAADGLVVATGGGPGAMEAAGLGAWLAAQPAERLEQALVELAAVPTFRPCIDAWVRSGFAVRDRFPRAGDEAGDDGGGPGGSLSVPTWHYGHEPPHVFATAIAKYFRNATREAVLLEVCDAGIVFLAGAGGTVQEIFQDACENYYADASAVAPMILVGRDYWTQQLPVWPLLQALARGRAMQDHVHLVERPEEAAALLDRPVNQSVNRPAGVR